MVKFVKSCYLYGIVEFMVYDSDVIVKFMI